jgi:signal transduction histidine kinase
VVIRFKPEISIAACDLALKISDGIVGKWDRTRLEQVATNLVSNAIKYGKGKPIHVSVSVSPNSAVLEVKDFGIGIAPEDRMRIFNRFERAVTAREFQGLGLGLYIVNEIIQAHQGTIQLESDLGKGSSFKIHLPLEVSPVAQASF